MREPNPNPHCSHESLGCYHRPATPIDLQTTLYVVKGAVEAAEAFALVHEHWCTEGAVSEMDLMDWLAVAAEILEEVYRTDFRPELFDGLIFAYEIAEAFGEQLMISIAAEVRLNAADINRPTPATTADLRQRAFELLHNEMAEEYPA